MDILIQNGVQSHKLIPHRLSPIAYHPSPIAYHPSPIAYRLSIPENKPVRLAK
jgi:hypothetical protein